MDAVDLSGRFLRRHWRVIAASALTGLALGVLYALLASKQYTARVMVEADMSRQEISPPQQNMVGSPSFDPNEIDSQIEVVKSANVLLPVVKQLKLEEDPQFSRHVGPLNRFLGIANVDEQAQTATALEALDKALDVKRLGKTHVIEMVFKAQNPARAAEIANAIANSFIQDRRQTKYEAVQKAIAWVENREEEARKQSSAADEALEQFKMSRTGTNVGAGRTLEQTQIELRELDNKARMLRAAYENYATFLHKDVEQLRQQSMPTSGARIISLALPPLKASAPKLSTVVVVALLAGFILGFAVALVRDMADRTFRTRQQVRKHFGAPCIAMIPQLGASASKPGALVRLLPSKVAKAFGDKLTIDAIATDHAARTPDLPPIIKEAPLSPFSEAMQSLRLTLDQDHDYSAAQVIGVTSALPNEGKSTIAATLAQTLAQAGKRVVLVDCDLRLAKLSKALSSKSSLGLRNVVTDQVSLESAMKRHEAGFMFLAAGSGAHARHPSEILTATDARIVFDELRKDADIIIVDLPPLSPVADARGASRLVDQYLLVVAWGETKVQIVEQSLEAAPTVKGRMLGVVLNKVDLDGLGNYEPAYVGYENYYSASPLFSSTRPAVI